MLGQRAVDLELLIVDDASDRSRRPTSSAASPTTGGSAWSAPNEPRSGPAGHATAASTRPEATSSGSATTTTPGSPVRPGMLVDRLDGRTAASAWSPRGTRSSTSATGRTVPTTGARSSSAAAELLLVQLRRPALRRGPPGLSSPTTAGRRGLPTCEDWDLWLRCAAAAPHRSRSPGSLRLPPARRPPGHRGTGADHRVGQAAVPREARGRPCPRRAASTIGRRGPRVRGGRDGHGAGGRSRARGRPFRRPPPGPSLALGHRRRRAVGRRRRDPGLPPAPLPPLTAPEPPPQAPGTGRDDRPGPCSWSASRARGRPGPMRVLSKSPGAERILEPDNEDNLPAAIHAKHRLGRYPVLVPGDDAPAYQRLWEWALDGGVPRADAARGGPAVCSAPDGRRAHLRREDGPGHLAGRPAGPGRRARDRTPAAGVAAPSPGRRKIHPCPAGRRVAQLGVRRRRRWSCSGTPPACWPAGWR